MPGLPKKKDGSLIRTLDLASAEVSDIMTALLQLFIILLHFLAQHPHATFDGPSTSTSKTLSKGDETFSWLPSLSLRIASDSTPEFLSKPLYLLQMRPSVPML